MVTIFWGNIIYLWHLTGSIEINSEATYYDICTISVPNFIKTESRVLADVRVQEKI